MADELEIPENGDQQLSINVGGMAVTAAVLRAQIYELAGFIAGLPPPLVAPTLATANSGGTVPDGTYYAVMAYESAAGVTVESPVSAVLVVAGAVADTSTITFTHGAIPAAATSGVRLYLTAANAAAGNEKYRTTRTTGTDYVFTSLPAAGADPPAATALTAVGSPFRNWAQLGSDGIFVTVLQIAGLALSSAKHYLVRIYATDASLDGNQFDVKLRVTRGLYRVQDKIDHTFRKRVVTDLWAKDDGTSIKYYTPGTATIEYQEVRATSAGGKLVTHTSPTFE